MRALIVLGILLMPFATAQAVSAAPEDLTEMSIEQLLNVEIISASRLGQKASQAPSSVSILTANDIRTFGWRTLAEALNSMRGLFTSNDRNYSFVGVRGFIQSGDYNSRVLFMIDGQRMNENIFDSGNIGQEFMLDMDLVERIEFIPGSGSTIYGANAFLGLINVVTKKGKAVNGAQMTGEVGSFDTYKGRVSYGKQFDNGTDVLVSASHYDSQGVEDLYFPAFDDPSTNNGIAHNMDTERADRLFGRMQFEEFTLSGGFVDRYKRVPTAAFGAVFNDPTSHTYDRQFFTNLKYEKALSAKTSFMAKGFYQGYDYMAEDPFNDVGNYIYHDQTSGRWWGGEAQLTTSVFDGHRLLFGLEYQYDQTQRQFGYVTEPYQIYQDSDLSGHRVELYAQDDIQLRENLVFSAGLRLDQTHMLKRLQLNPRLGLIWNPLENTTFKLLYSSTFRAPHAWNLDYNPYYYGVSPELHEEQIRSYEAITEWHSNTGLKLLVSLFYNDITELLKANPDTALLDNVGKYHAYGAEWEAEKRWDSGRMFKASYTYSLFTNEGKHGVWATGSPQNIFKLHYAEPLFDDFVRLGIENIYIGDRKTFQGGEADAYNLVNLNLSTDRLLRGLDVSFGVYNLFDSHYEMLINSDRFDLLQMNGREFRLKLQLTF
ncbi:TonB-dependent receptor [Methylomonas sp. MO1]|uniref:TonB-dependent receptor plug domain-containing protein n=1 Tax=unclassified Methylomonas TaxID=2608980 RepID=UPI0004790A0C|nr:MULTISPECIES: TonB-dependent receptor [unclassified Methylomonas]MDT4291404.1 TonB-dependent receptor [Methylomonas sp. MO1]